MHAVNRIKYSLISSSNNTNNANNNANDPNVYVYQLINHPQLPENQFLATASDQSIKLYDATTASSKGGPEIRGQWRLSSSSSTTLKGQIRDTIFIDCHTAACAVSDGTLQIFDLRQSMSPVRILYDPNGRPYTCLSVDCAQQVLAAGTEWENSAENALVRLWDLRQLPSSTDSTAHQHHHHQNQLLGELSESFGDDLTTLTFHPIKQRCLQSGSTDGLCCVFDLDHLRPGDETDALQAVFNSGSSVSKAGFFGPASEYVYLLTHIESLSLWSLRTGTMLADLGDVRRPEVIRMADGCDNSQSLIDYMIDCWWSRDDGKLSLAAGTFDGTVRLFNVTLNGLQPLHTLSNAHPDSVVRSVLPLGGSYITGGEDAQLIVWSSGGGGNSSNNYGTGQSKHAADHLRVHRKRAAPY